MTRFAHRLHQPERDRIRSELSAAAHWLGGGRRRCNTHPTNWVSRLAAVLILTLGALGLPHHAQASVPMWGTVPGPSPGYFTFFKTQYEACQYQHDYYDPAAPFYGATPYPGYWDVYQCQWPPGYLGSLPTGIYLYCTDGN